MNRPRSIAAVVHGDTQDQLPSIPSCGPFGLHRGTLSWTSVTVNTVICPNPGLIYAFWSSRKISGPQYGPHDRRADPLELWSCDSVAASFGAVQGRIMLPRAPTRISQRSPGVSRRGAGRSAGATAAAQWMLRQRGNSAHAPDDYQRSISANQGHSRFGAILGCYAGHTGEME